MEKHIKHRYLHPCKLHNTDKAITAFHSLVIGTHMLNQVILILGQNNVTIWASLSPQMEMPLKIIRMYSNDSPHPISIKVVISL